MGLCVTDYYSRSEYFCLSSIDKRTMLKHGINLSIEELKQLAKNSKPFDRVLTGSRKVIGNHRKTNVYRYIDFVK